jgi:hypothetical protein
MHPQAGFHAQVEQVKALTALGATKIATKKAAQRAAFSEFGERD